ncbi:quinone oxidoreductase family protein [Mycobacterium palustre]|uniref:Alcohol dehydrogenase n=1 Tax=Mycobacterium palustre TaxID=153971 RepID=A0A1X1ZS04_9MYCO|nr:zinc-binding alcohol dehydrogenase family protein [Mycobacterium palustre]MCV7100161.1 zinc-binding alcohol dehydrogenase family protein [Mycobacterium palustre]ORW26150.1 alcohol dehydrogenase [Mycobacterium palustre]
MKAAVVNTLGPAPVYADFVEPQPEDGAVVAAVEAAALKNIDRALVSGRHYSSSTLPLPMVAGVDGVARLDDGRLVYAAAVAPFGMMAERALIDPNRVVELPEGFDPVTAAAVPNPGISAFYSLQEVGHIRAGSRVLILGATGVAGSMAVMLAKSYFGAGRVVAAGRNTERLDWLRTVGADEVIELGIDDVTERVAAEHDAQPFDIVIDFLWGEPTEQVLAALANEDLQASFHLTRFVQVGESAGPSINLPAGTMRSAGIELCGLGPASIPADAQARITTEALPRLFAMAADGRLPIDTRVYPLSDVESLWTAREPSGTRVILVPQ